MQLDPITFLLEILNFFVLLWLLQHFFYRPIKAAIARRQQAMEKGVQEARQREQAAATLKDELQAKLDDWEQEKRRQEEALQREITEAREAALLRVQKAAEQEQTRLQALQVQEDSERQRQIDEQAGRAALQLASRMLERLSGPELDDALINMLYDDLKQLPETDIQQLQTVLKEVDGHVVVTSARDLGEARINLLRQNLSEVLGQAVHCRVDVDASLLSGVRLNIGAHVLHASIGDELAFFGTVLNHDVH